MLRPILVTAPATLPVTLDDMKAHGVIDFADDDALVQGILDAAVARLDGYSGILGRCLVSQGWQQDYACWRGRMRLPFPDCSALTITYYDSDGSQQTVSSSLYEVLEGSQGTFVSFKSGFTEPTLDDDRDYPVSIAFTAGYGAADDVPAAIRRAIMMLADHILNNRDGGGEVPPGVRALTENYRRVGL